MAIAKKPSNNKRDIDLTDAIISKGGSSSSEQLFEENHHIKVTIRLPSKMLNMIDNYLAKSIGKKTRTCWVREAVEEKIKNDLS
jgi:hypothetical protein